MNNYFLVNLVALPFAIAVALLVFNKRQLIRLLKISLLAPPLAFPWLYFGISQKAWAHGDPGPLFMNVPLNELLLTFLMTFVNGGILLKNYSAILHESGGGTKAKDGAAEKKQDDPC